eukprot:gene25182-33705_t
MNGSNSNSGNGSKPFSNRRWENKQTHQQNPTAETPPPTPFQQVSKVINGLNNMDSLKHRVAFFHLMNSLTGTDVVVNHYTGKQIAGVLFTVTPFQGMTNQCVLKAAREERDDGSPIESPLLASGSTAVLDSDKAIVAIRTGSKIDLHRKTGPGADSQFQVDSSIKSQDLSFLHGRTLETVSNAWLPSETNTDLQSMSTGGWDQFEVNRTKFGVKSTYDENLYTKRIDYSSMTPEQIAKAERIAREIEGTVSSNIHFQEERGQAMEQELDEEDRFSGVRRVPVSNEKVSPNPQENVNPWSRGLKLGGGGPQTAGRSQPVTSSKSKQQSTGRNHAQGRSLGPQPASLPQSSSSVFENEMKGAVAEEPSSPMLAAPGLTVIPNIDNRSTSFSPLGGEKAESDGTETQTMPPSATESEATMESTAEAASSFEPNASIADPLPTADSAQAAPEEQKTGVNPTSSTEEAPSKLNPKAKEFKFNPNAKEFNFQPGAFNQFGKPPQQQAVPLVPQQQAMRLGYNPVMMPGEVLIDTNGHIVNNPQLPVQWISPAPGPGGAIPFDAQRMNMAPNGAQMYQQNQFYQQANGDFMVMQPIPMQQIPMEFAGAMNPAYGMQMQNVMPQNMGMGVGMPGHAPMYIQNPTGMTMVNVGPEYPVAPNGNVMMLPHQFQGVPYPGMYGGQPMQQQAMYGGAGMMPPAMAVQPGGLGPQKPGDGSQGGQSGGGGGRYMNNNNGNNNDSGGRNNSGSRNPGNRHGNNSMGRGGGGRNNNNSGGGGGGGIRSPAAASNESSSHSTTGSPNDNSSGSPSKS